MAESASGSSQGYGYMELGMQRSVSVDQSPSGTGLLSSRRNKFLALLAYTAVVVGVVVAITVTAIDKSGSESETTGNAGLNGGLRSRDDVPYGANGTISGFVVKDYMARTTKKIMELHLEKDKEEHNGGLQSVRKPKLQGADGTCWKHTTPRGVGKVLSACRNPEYPEKDAGLCYKRCPADKPHGIGPVCWADCPEGYTDEGALCAINLKVTSADNSACPWYDICGLTFAKGCSKCPAGLHNDGCTCRRVPHIDTKGSVGRGVGIPMDCPEGEDEQAGLCYVENPDPEKYKCVGPVCWQHCPPDRPIDAGAMCCKSTLDCAVKITQQTMSVLSTVASAVETGFAPEDVMNWVKTVKDAVDTYYDFDLPMCDMNGL